MVSEGVDRLASGELTPLRASLSLWEKLVIKEGIFTPIFRLFNLPPANNLC